jgi:transcriptional regulator with XRE-family HTH domain
LGGPSNPSFLGTLYCNEGRHRSQPQLPVTVSCSPTTAGIEPGASMSPKQCRAARAWLNWSRLQLADKAGVSIGTVRDFEAGRRIPTADNLKAIRRALEDAGIQLLFARRVPVGVTFHGQRPAPHRDRRRAGVSKAIRRPAQRAASAVGQRASRASAQAATRRSPPGHPAQPRPNRALSAAA